MALQFSDEAFDMFDIVGDPNTGSFSPIGGGQNALELFLAAQGGPVGLGLGVGSKLFKFLSGRGARKKKKGLFKDVGALIEEALSQKGKPIFNVEDIFAKTVAGAEPSFKRKGREFDERFGFDQGRAGGEFSRLLAEFLGSQRTGLETREAEGRSRRDRDLIRLALEGKQLQSGLI